MNGLTRIGLVGAASAVLALCAGCHVLAANQAPPATGQAGQVVQTGQAQPTGQAEPPAGPGDSLSSQLDQLQSTLDGVQAQLSTDATP